MKRGEAELRIVLVTAPSRRARGMARRLVKDRVAACVNVVPAVRSIYRWEGAVQEGAESLLIIKTTVSALDDLERTVLSIHPYEVPEFVVLPVERALASYGRWIAESTGPQDTRGPNAPPRPS